MKSHVRYACGAAVLALGLAGCASNSEPEFGSSVRHMVKGQIHDPSAPVYGTVGLDGQKATQALDTYHGTAKKPAAKSSAATAVMVPTSQ
jgi:hypothetical protein